MASSIQYKCAKCDVTLLWSDSAIVRPVGPQSPYHFRLVGRNQAEGPNGTIYIMQQSKICGPLRREALPK